MRPLSRPLVEGFELRPLATACYNYRDSPDGASVKLTAIIVPLRVEEKGGVVEVSWACSLGRSCCFYRCVYAHGKGGEAKPELLEEAG